MFLFWILDQEFDIEKMLQPNDKIHNYDQTDLEESIKDMYSKLLCLSNCMDKVLDYTSHLPNFRNKCKIFITMSGEIDIMTKIIFNNLKATKKIKE